MMTKEEFAELAYELEAFHGIFSRLWYFGVPVKDTTIPTACIRFDKKGRSLSFCFNPDFYAQLDDYNRKFIICHEMLHVILNHGIRGRTLDPELANIAMDVVINETLVNNFNFDRNKIKDWQKYCWYDTTFVDRTIEKNKNFEYYYDLLNTIKNKNGYGMVGKKYKGDPSNPGNGTETVDVHNGFGSDGDEDVQAEIDEMIAESVSKLSPEQLQELKSKIKSAIDDETNKELQRGTGSGGLTIIMAGGKVAKKRKWETVIKRWMTTKLRRADKMTEQWARINRRFVTLSRDLFIPTEMEIENRNKEKCKIKVVFFLDTSGSCKHLAERFWAAAKSLPEDRFELHLCCFDTKVYETSLVSSKLYGFGGTSFDILENYVQQLKKKDGKYPEAVFVITDGMGNNIKPEHPEKWYWFLSANYKQCIPKECNMFNLTDYE
jgi:predicted metal-dependent peptidase